MANQANSEIKYLTPIAVDVKKKKYCRFKKSGIKYIRESFCSYPDQVAQAVKRARHLALMPYVADLLK